MSTVVDTLAGAACHCSHKRGAHLGALLGRAAVVDKYHLSYYIPNRGT